MNARHLAPALLLPLLSLTAQVAPPKLPEVPDQLPPQIRLLQPGVKLTLLAEHPDLVTPTGADVDAQGNVWLIACHTHQRPEGYTGPEHDEVLVFDAQGRNRRVFYNRTKTTMNLQLGRDGWVYLAERSRLLRVKDTDGDGRGDREETLAALDTVSDYPHNGLSGMAWDPQGELVFALGENFGKDWTLTGTDGRKVSGRGEGGVFRCSADGQGLRRIARGFWNPFGLAVRADGEIFAAENDPGSRPPCRLLNILEGADYGYQWVYGSAPVHPFVAWNGELRGTLGMIHPSGEGPSSIVPLGGGVLIPSWSSHCIDFFPLHRQGAGYTSQRVELLRGSDFFRPVCVTAANESGVFYVTDWVFSSYPNHGRGRLWKLEIESGAPWQQPQVEPLNDATRLANDLRSGRAERPVPELFELARGADRWLADAALSALARASRTWTPESVRALPAADRVWALVALRRVNLADERWVRALWDDADPEIRFECLRWVADAVLTGFTADVEKLLARPDLDFRLFEATLAAWNTLRGNPGAGVTDAAVLLERLSHPATPVRLRGYALRLLPPQHPKLKTAQLEELLALGDAALALEVVRTLAARTDDAARGLLAAVAADSARPEALRVEAVAGLAASPQPEHQALLVKLAAGDSAALRQEALRGLRLTGLNDSAKPALQAVADRHPDSAPLVQAVLDPGSLMAGRPAFDATDAWLQRLQAAPGQADPEAGRRLFFHARLGLCSSCHRHGGRGNVVGPDLSFAGQQGDARALLQSLLEPHREVAPQFYPTHLKLADGTDFTGILLRSSNIDVYRDLTGKERVFQKKDVVERTELKTSLMPMGLVASLTDAEVRDLLAFLRAGAQP